MNFVDITGQKFGKLTVSRRMPSVNKRTMWECVCDCGQVVVVEAYNLKSGHTSSCGCVQKERTSAASLTHGQTRGQKKTRLYRIWVCMKIRCYHRSYHAFKHYGGRGITVCDEWLSSFEAFYEWSMSHGYQDDLSIDRIDVNGNYCPENCRWATMAEQNKNKRAVNGYKVKE